MANTFPAAVKARLAASGSGAAVSLFEVLTIAGNRYFWSDSDIAAPVALVEIVPGLAPTFRPTYTYPVQQFQPWLLDAGPFKTYRSTQTSTGSVRVQNVSGNTVQRDVSLIYSREELCGALCFFRQWLADAQFATFTFMGTVDDASISADGDSMTLQLESLCNWSKIDAPYEDIGPSCQLSFGSVECGSTASTPCNNSYGTCTSTERFLGVIQEWTGAGISSAQYVQPEPLRLNNGRVAG